MPNRKLPRHPEHHLLQEALPAACRLPQTRCGSEDAHRWEAGMETMLRAHGDRKQQGWLCQAFDTPLSATSGPTGQEIRKETATWT